MDNCPQETEEWVLVYNATDYEVNRAGTVRYRSGLTPRRGALSNIVKFWKDKDGRPVAVLRSSGHKIRLRQNVIVYTAFCGKLPRRFKIEHIDGDFLNCRADNLKLSDSYIPEENDNRLAGQRFGYWTVVSRSGKDRYGNAMWLCRCVCGSKKRVQAAGLMRGVSRNCGCKNALMRDSTGNKNPSWKGGQKIVGSKPWMSAKIRTVNLHSKKSGHAPIANDVDEVLSLFSASNGKCDICGESPSGGKMLHMDHCHASGVVRGFLCNHCNVALGMAKDNSSLLRKMADYIDVHNFRIADGKVRAS